MNICRCIKMSITIHLWTLNMGHPVEHYTQNRKQCVLFRIFFLSQLSKHLPVGCWQQKTQRAVLKTFGWFNRVFACHSAVLTEPGASFFFIFSGTGSIFSPDGMPYSALQHTVGCSTSNLLKLNKSPIAHYDRFVVPCTIQNYNFFQHQGVQKVCLKSENVSK